MITANVIHRVFRIALGDEVGTAFTIDVERRQYLVTARHVVADLTRRGHVNLFAKGVWNPIAVKVVGHAPGDVDISVLSPGRRLTPEDLPLDARSDGLIYSQDAYFLGFPYNMLTAYVLGPEGYPVPLAKKAIVSALDKELYLLDGHNNPGFSGGPVVFVRSGERDLSVAGVISSFRAVDEPILRHGKKTEMFYEYNTGIIVAYKIEYAVDMIRSNPIGLKL